MQAETPQGSFPRSDGMHTMSVGRILGVRVIRKGEHTIATDRLAPGMLDNPDLSRQWVLRRLQRALTLDLAAAAWQAGIATTSGKADRACVATLSEHAAQRAVVLRRLITELGSAPYSSIGLARAAARAGGVLMGLCGRWAWGSLAHQLATHTLSEYDVLRAFVDGAKGVERDLQPHVAPLLVSAEQGMRTLAGTATNP